MAPANNKYPDHGIRHCARAIEDRFGRPDVKDCQTADPAADSKPGANDRPLIFVFASIKLISGA